MTLLRTGLALLAVLSANALAFQQAPKEPFADRAIIEQKFAALDAWNSSTVDDLYDAVLAVGHFQRLPEFASQFVKPKVSRAEAAFWQGQTSGVSEKDLVAVLNGAADRMQLPEFAKITETQVRLLRFELVRINPKFMSAKFLQFDAATGQFQVATQMSPLQAMYVAQTIIDSKFGPNAKFQVTPAEWEASIREPQPPPKRKTVTYALMVGTSDKSRQIQAAFNKSLSQMSDADGIELLSKMLERFGVK